MLKRIFIGLLLAVVLLAAAVEVKTWTTPSRQLAVAPAPKLDIDLPAHKVRIDSQLPADTFAKALDEEGYTPAA